MHLLDKLFELVGGLRYQTCVGFQIYKFGSHTCEIWFCPPGYEIPEHKHPHEDIELMFLRGEAIFRSRSLTKGGQEQTVYVTSPHDTFKHFTVNCGDYHSFYVTSLKWLVFMNFSKWLPGYKPTSASQDFQLATKI